MSLHMVYKSVCFVNGCLMATSVTHMATKAIKPWLTCTEKVAHKPACFERRLKTLSYILSKALFSVDDSVK